MKYALVTGGSRGIGRAVAIKLAGQGWPVLINYRSNQEAAQATLDEIVAAGGQGELLPFDVSDPQATDAAMEQWESEHPDDYVAVLVNNAGIRRDNVMFMMSDEDWHNVLDTTLNGFFYITRRLLKHMMPRKRGGRIINMASLSGLKGLPGQTNYSAAKAALIGATKALAQEVAGRGVTVNAIAPGFIATDMTSELPVDELTKLIPAGRFGRPEEVAALVAFLASDDAAYITGQAISINGGLYT
jgi:3-oxoacyl-[acyl-carrier protein] reductase